MYTSITTFIIGFYFLSKYYTKIKGNQTFFIKIPIKDPDLDLQKNKNEVEASNNYKDIFLK